MFYSISIHKSSPGNNILKKSINSNLMEQIYGIEIEKVTIHTFRKNVNGTFRKKS